jgi:phosphohistidine phosphatase SixA
MTTAKAGVDRSTPPVGKIRLMAREYASLRRKTFFLPFLLGGALGIAALGIGWWLHGRIVAGNVSTLVVVTRHAEKDLSGGEDPALTTVGAARAERLAALVPGLHGELGFDHVYVTQWRRSIDTARPVLNLSHAALTRVQSDDIAGLVRHIRDQDAGHRVLVVAHSDTVPDIVEKLAPGTSIPQIGDQEYGTVYIVAVPRIGAATVLRLRVP